MGFDAALFRSHCSASPSLRAVSNLLAEVELKTNSTKISLKRSDDLPPSSMNNLGGEIDNDGVKVGYLWFSVAKSMKKEATTLSSFFDFSECSLFLPHDAQCAFVTKWVAQAGSFCCRGAWMHHTWQLFHYHSHRWLHWPLTTERLTSTFAKTPLIYSSHILNFERNMLAGCVSSPQKHIYQKNWGSGCVIKMDFFFFFLKMYLYSNSLNVPHRLPSSF